MKNDLIYQKNNFTIFKDGEKNQKGKKAKEVKLEDFALID